MPLIEFPYVHLLPKELFGGIFKKINDNLYRFHDDNWIADSRHFIGWAREAIHSLEKIQDNTKLPVWLYGHAFKLKPDGTYVVSDKVSVPGVDEKVLTKKQIIDFSQEVHDKILGADQKGDQWGTQSHNEWFETLEERLKSKENPIVKLARQVVPDPLEFYTLTQNIGNAFHHPAYPKVIVAQNASGIGQTHANTVLDWDFQGVSATPSTTEYLALFTAAPTDTTLGTETSYTSYARLSITMNSTNWPNASAGAITYSQVATFATCGTTGATITDAALNALSSGGSQNLYWGDLTGGSQVINSGNTPQFNANSIVVSMA